MLLMLLAGVGERERLVSDTTGPFDACCIQHALMRMCDV
jgi:hypothetical protein